MEEEIAEITRIVKKYVDTFGGEVAVSSLEDDLKITYRDQKMPYEKYQFPDLLSFLASISSLRIIKVKNEYYVQNQRWKRFPQSQAHSSNRRKDMSTPDDICVEVGNLLLEGRRKVVINSAERNNLKNRKLILENAKKFNSGAKDINSRTRSSGDSQSLSLCPESKQYKDSTNYSSTYSSIDSQSFSSYPESKQYRDLDYSNGDFQPFKTYSGRHNKDSVYSSGDSQSFTPCSGRQYRDMNYSSDSQSFTSYSGVQYKDPSNRSGDTQSHTPYPGAGQFKETTSDPNLYASNVYANNLETGKSTGYSEYSPNNSLFSTPSSCSKSDESNFEVTDPFKQSGSYTDSYELVDVDMCYAKSIYYITLIKLTVENKLPLPDIGTYSSYCSVSNRLTYTIVIKVGTELFISTPCLELPSFWIYEELLKDACECVRRKYAVAKTQNSDVSAALTSIINSFDKGVTIDVVQRAYLGKYSVPLPPNWQNTLLSSNFYVEPLSTEIVVYPKRTFTTPVPCVASLPQLTLPQTKPYEIYVTNCVTVNNIWFRVAETESILRYEILTEEMRKFYAEQSINVAGNSPKTKELYAVLFNDHWSRIEITQVEETQVEGFLLEHGMKVKLSTNSLFPLNEKFTNTPPLAARCALAGLTDYENINYLQCNLKRLISNKTVRVTLESVGVSKVSVHMYLNEPTIKTSVNVYLQKIIKEQLNVPQMVQENMTVNIKLLHVDESGLARVQIESYAIKLLETSFSKVLQRIEEAGSDEKFKLKSLVNCDSNEVFLIRGHVGFERVRIVKIISSQKVIGTFIDTGVTKTVDVQNLISCSQFPDTIQFIAPLYKEVQIIKNDSYAQSIILFLHQVSKFTDVSIAYLFMRVVKNGEIPVVELLKKTADNNLKSLKYLFLQNSSLLTDMKLLNNLRSFVPPFMASELKRRLKPDTSIIPVADFKKGYTFDVSLLKAFSPSDFVLKFENNVDFETLMLNLNNYYKIYSPQPVSDVLTGHCYAVQLENGVFYRGLVLHYFQELGTLVVRLVDFAEYTSVPLTGTYALLRDFCKIPSQTFNSRFVNLKSTSVEWSDEECWRFKGLVCDRQLRCVIMNTIDELVEVELFDISDPPGIVNVFEVFVSGCTSVVR